MAMEEPLRPSPCRRLQKGLALGANSNSNFAATFNWVVDYLKKARSYFVKSLNGLQGHISIVGGNNVTVTPAGDTITIEAQGGSGSGGVTSLNAATGDVTISGGGAVSVTRSGTAITVSTSSSISQSITLYANLRFDTTANAFQGNAVTLTFDNGILTSFNYSAAATDLFVTTPLTISNS